MTIETKTAENPTEDEKASMLLYGQIDDLRAQLYGTARLANRLLRVFVTLAEGGMESCDLAAALKQVFVEEKENLLANARGKLAKFQELGAPHVIVENAEEVVEKLTRQCERAQTRSTAEFVRLVERATAIYTGRMNFNLLLDLGAAPEFPDSEHTAEEKRAKLVKW